MGIPFQQQYRVGKYLVTQSLKGRKRFPLVLNLEPLFRCNLACAGCGKIDYPAPILNQRLSVAECLEAVDECGAPVVVIAGGEPLLHREMPEIVREVVGRKKIVYLCTNALLLEKKLDDYEPSDFFTWSVHLDGEKPEHDHAVSQEGVFEKAVSAIAAAKAKGFRVTINCTLFNNAVPEKVAKFFDYAMGLGIDGIMMSPGYAYERAPDQQSFLNRTQTKTLFRDIFARNKGAKVKWAFNASPLFLDFLAGNQSYHCTPWGMPTRNYFGWQKPCYLLGEGYAKTYRELVEETDWDAYGVGKYEKCTDCMVHSGYEMTAVHDTMKNPLKGLKLALTGIKTEGPMTPDVSLANVRPAEYLFSNHVAQAMARLSHKPQVTVQQADAAD